jgi:hypothetical protein
VTVRFDDSLPGLAEVVADALGEEALLSGLVLRDTSGRLAFLSSSELPKATVKVLTKNLRDRLGVYARTDRTVADIKDVGVRELLDDAGSVIISLPRQRLRLLDRRLVGADWQRRPAPLAKGPPRFVFASLKGGVGRSTALAVGAVAQAARSRRVLAVDLDLEAPGLGAFLLEPATLPEFGLIDALVENGLGPLDERFMADLVGPSAISQHKGRIDVIPALGRRSMENPGEVLAKIARAYGETMGADGATATILDQVRTIVDRFANSRRYDAIFVDARAGLHETTASAILGLGAEVFLFGVDEPQTFQGYAILLAHLARFAEGERFPPEWLQRVTMVQAKAPASGGERAAFMERCETLFAAAGLSGRHREAARSVPLPAGPFSDVPWDETVRDEELGIGDADWLPEPIAILEDERFRHVGQLRWMDLLVEDVFRSSYGMLLQRIEEIVGKAESDLS